MEKEPGGIEPSEYTPISEKSFNLGQFKTELTQKTEEYAEVAYDARLVSDGKEEEIKAEELRNQLLDVCVNALESTADNKEVIETINKILINYRYKVGVELFGGSQKSDFYSDLLLRVTKKKDAPIRLDKN